MKPSPEPRVIGYSYSCHGPDGEKVASSHPLTCPGSSTDVAAHVEAFIDGAYVRTEFRASGSDGPEAERNIRRVLREHEIVEA